MQAQTRLQEEKKRIEASEKRRLSLGPSKSTNGGALCLSAKLIYFSETCLVMFQYPRPLRAGCRFVCLSTVSFSFTYYLIWNEVTPSASCYFRHFLLCHQFTDGQHATQVSSSSQKYLSKTQKIFKS